jgi:hypothetical protein
MREMDHALVVDDVYVHSLMNQALDASGGRFAWKEM